MNKLKQFIQFYLSAIDKNKEVLDTSIDIYSEFKGYDDLIHGFLFDLESCYKDRKDFLKLYCNIELTNKQEIGDIFNRDYSLSEIKTHDCINKLDIVFAKSRTSFEAMSYYKLQKRYIKYSLDRIEQLTGLNLDNYNNTLHISFSNKLDKDIYGITVRKANSSNHGDIRIKFNSNSLRKKFNLLLPITVHELTHTVISANSYILIPNLFDEGIAQYCQGYLPNYNKVLKVLTRTERGINKIKEFLNNYNRHNVDGAFGVTGYMLLKYLENHMNHKKIITIHSL